MAQAEEEQPMPPRDLDFGACYGPWAVVAGASEGLGAQFAAQLAARRLNLALIARRAAMLNQLAAQLKASYSVQVRTIELDLGRADCGAIVAGHTGDIEVGLLVYNAARSVIGPFFAQPLDQHLNELDVNCRAPLTLAYTLGQRMLERGRGGIVLMSSLSAAQGSPMIANYAATKAYNQLLAEGLWDELRGQGVDVLACCAGATTTPNYLASAPKRGGATAATAMSPRGVVAEALAALGRQPSVVPGGANRLAAFVMRRLLPRRAAIAIMGQTLRKMYGEPKRQGTG
jgi:short-subunit dehydrogenase